MGVEITGKTLGIIGCGNIGSIVADRAIGLKMRVIAFDPFLSPERALRDRRREGRARRAAGPRRLHHAAHADDAADQEHPRRAENLAKTKKGVRIINCARGGLVDEEALRAALDQRPCGGRGLRRLHRGAGQGEPAVRASQRRLHAASGRLDQRGAGERRPAGRRADVGLSDRAAPSRTRSTSPRSPPRKRRS